MQTLEALELEDDFVRFALPDSERDSERSAPWYDQEISQLEEAFSKLTGRTITDTVIDMEGLFVTMCFYPSLTDNEWNIWMKKLKV